MEATDCAQSDGPGVVLLSVLVSQVSEQCARIADDTALKDRLGCFSRGWAWDDCRRHTIATLDSFGDAGWVGVSLHDADCGSTRAIKPPGRAGTALCVIGANRIGGGDGTHGL